MTRSAIAILILLVTGCSAPAGSAPLPSISDTGIHDVFLDVAWPSATTVLASRPIPGSDPERRQLVSINLASGEVSPLPVERPSECPSIDAFEPRVLAQGVIFDLRCYPGPNTPIGGYHQLMALPTGDEPARALVQVPWFPQAFVQVEGGAWLSSYDDGLCAWIDTIPSTGQPSFPWPIVITDDGPPYSVNEARSAATCDAAPLASGVTLASDGSIAFLASATASSTSAMGRVDAPRNLYMMNPRGVLRRLAGSIQHGVNLSWDPSGKWLVVTALIDGRQGVWRFDREGSRTLVYDGLALNVTWSPDGRRLAILVPGGDPTASDSVSRLLLISAPS